MAGGLVTLNMSRGLHRGSYQVANTLSKVVPETPFEEIEFETEDAEPVSMNGSTIAFTVADGKIQSFPWSQQQVVLALLPSHPNPFRSSSAFRYQIQTRSSISPGVYAYMGQLVRTLVEESKNSGCYTTKWDGLNESGKRVSPGVYFCQLSAGKEARTRNVVLVR